MPVAQGSIFWSEKYIYIFPPPLSENDIFPPLMTRSFFTPIVLFLTYFYPILHLLNPFTSHFSLSFLLYSFFPLSSFYSEFSPLFSSPFHNFPPNDIGWYSALGGRGIFQYIDPCSSKNSEGTCCTIFTASTHCLPFVVAKESPGDAGPGRGQAEDPLDAQALYLRPLGTRPLAIKRKGTTTRFWTQSNNHSWVHVLTSDLIYKNVE